MSDDSTIDQTLSLQKSIRLNSQMAGRHELLLLSDTSEEGKSRTSEALDPSNENPYNAITFLNRALSATSVIHISQTWGNTNLAKFPPEYRFPADLLVTEYITPLPSPIRFALIDLFCPPKMQETQMRVPGNRDCLARIYLGANSSGRTNRFFSLRNFKLFHDRMQRLGLDLPLLVGKMASSMALMHFGGNIDGRDVEFVLGYKVEPTEKISLEELERLAPCTDTLDPTASVEPGPWNYCRRRVEMFVLDFNQCRSIEMTREGMETAAEAFVINDPYCPRPHHADEGIQKLWVHFCQVYRETAVKVADPEMGKGRTDELVDWFLESINARVRARQSRGQETE